MDGGFDISYSEHPERCALRLALAELFSVRPDFVCGKAATAGREINLGRGVGIFFKQPL